MRDTLYFGSLVTKCVYLWQRTTCKNRKNLKIFRTFFVIKDSALGVALVKLASDAPAGDFSAVGRPCDRCQAEFFDEFWQSFNEFLCRLFDEFVLTNIYGEFVWQFFCTHFFYEFFWQFFFTHFLSNFLTYNLFSHSKLEIWKKFEPSLWSRTVPLESHW